MRRTVLMCISAVLALSVPLIQPAGAQDAGADRLRVDMSKLNSQQQQSLMQQLSKNELDILDKSLLVDRNELVQAIKVLQGRNSLAWPTQPSESGIDLNVLAKFQSRVQRVFSPVEGGKEILKVLSDIKMQCAMIHTSEAQRNSCFTKMMGPDYQSMLDAMAVGGMGCDQAAIDYREFLLSCAPNCPQQGKPIKRRFDSTCMNSNLAWRREDGSFRADAEPSAFRVGGNRDGVAGILDAVMLIELDEQGHRKHLCGGLLLSGNRVLTAQHCFLPMYAQTALKEGWAYVRRLGSGHSQRYRLLDSDTVARTRVSTAQDYVVLKFDADVILPSPRIQFLPVTKPSRALIYGYFGDFDVDRVLAGSESSAGVSDIPTWTQGMRWAKPGLCHVMEAFKGCVRTLCQTVSGYSGAPIFDEKSTPDKPLIVYGVISQANHPNSECGNVDSLTTLAASASDVTP